MLRLANSVIGPVAPQYYGISPGSAGLYQINVAVSRGAPAGDAPVALIFPGSASNTVSIALQ
jgi:uncharacterized protein (TIGR03437 family)